MRCQSVTLWLASLLYRLTPSDPATTACLLRGKKRFSAQNASPTVDSNRRSNLVDRQTASTDKDRSCRSIPGRGTVTRGIDRRPPADNSVTTGRLLFSICSSAQTSTDPCCPYAAKLLPRPPCGYSSRAVWKSPFLRIIRLWASVVDRPNTGPFSDVIDQTATHLKSVPTSALRVNSWHMPAARHAVRGVISCGIYPCQLITSTLYGTKTVRIRCDDLARTPGADLKFNKEGAVRNKGFEGRTSSSGLKGSGSVKCIGIKSPLS